MQVQVANRLVCGSMGKSSVFVRVLRSIQKPALVALAACVPGMVTAAAALPESAWAASHGPRYTLKIVEGETTLPEYDQIASTSGSVEPNGQVAVSIIRNGTTVYRDVEEGGSAWLSQVPQAGEVVTLEAPVGRLIGSVVYDGLPSIDPTVCAGSTNFSGENSSGDVVEGSYFTDSLQTSRGRVTGVRHTGNGEAQVKTLSGTTFGGSFLTPLSLGQTVVATESLKSPLAGEATYTYISEIERPVGTCPPPPPPPVFSPPPPPVLQGTILELLHETIRSVLKSGWRDHVTINQAGTVTQDLYLQGGKLPAYAASSGKGKHHHPTPPALLLARGTVTAKGPGTVTVVLKLTAKGRAKFKAAKHINAILVTTLRSSTGSKLNLARRSVTLHR
jgi:hypothetical protein